MAFISSFGVHLDFFHTRISSTPSLYAFLHTSWCLPNIHSADEPNEMAGLPELRQPIPQDGVVEAEVTTRLGNKPSMIASRYF